MTTPKSEPTEFDKTYARLRAFVAATPGPALRIATHWHMQEITLLKSQLENMQAEIASPSNTQIKNVNLWNQD